MKISFYTTCMGRLHHLKQTLPYNLNIAKDFNVEFNICNYSSKDGLHEWIQKYINRINYIKINGKEKFNRSHAKNIAAKLCTGDIICNLDADVFLTKEFVLFINSAFDNNKNLVMHPNVYNIYGAICVEKNNFYKLSGYSENIKDWGAEDEDLVSRAKYILGLTHAYINPKLLTFIEHSDEERAINGESKCIERNKEKNNNYTIAKHHIKNKILNPNSNSWGNITEKT